MARRTRQKFTRATGEGRSGEHGFTLIQIAVTLVIISIVTTFAVMGVTRTRRAMRLSASERELAGYLEKARTDSMRRHATDAAQMATIVIPGDGGTTYTVTMDFDKDGTIDPPRTISLRAGVAFEGFGKTITFNWRGQTTGEVSIGLVNESNETTNIHVTGAGDITLNTELFQDAWVPNVDLERDSVSEDVITDATASNVANTATPTPYPTVVTDPSPTTDPTPKTDPTPSTDPTPKTDPTPSTDPTPKTDPTPESIPCTLSVSSSSLSVGENGGTTFYAQINNPSGSYTITAVPRNSGQIQVSPSSQVVTTNSRVGFSVTVKKNGGTIDVTTSPTCGSQSVAVTVN